MDFLDWYKKIVESSQEEPPADLWEDIQDELDVDMVWQNLEANLLKNKRKSMLYTMAAAASIALLFGFGTVFFYNAFYKTTYKQYIVNSFELSEEDTSFPVSTKEDEIVQMTFLEEHESKSRIKAKSPEYINKEHPESQIFEEQVDIILKPLPRFTLQSEQQFFDNGTETTRSEIVPLLIQKEEQNIIKGSYYAGLSGHASNTWLLNYKTKQGLKSDDLTATLPSFGYNIGVVAGRTINKNIKLQAEVYFISQSRQNYNEYVHGKYVSNKMKLNYTNISLICKYSFLYSEKHSSNHFLLLGVYTGFLRNAYQYLNGSPISLKNEYSSFDYGAIGGYEYTFPVGGNFALSTGFQVKYGLSNIFSGNEYIPDYLNNTRNLSANLMLSVKYKIN